MKALRFAVVFGMPLALLPGLILGGGAWFWLPLVYGFVTIPVADAFGGLDLADPPEGEEANPLYDGILRLWVVVQGLVMLAAFYRVAQGVAPGELLALGLSLGVITSAGGINVAHELMHRREALDRALAELLMSSVSYPHFCIEHVLGHHKNVSTPLDPASSRLGQSLYAYWPQTLIGGLRSAWALESDRVQRRGLTAFGPQDRRARYAIWVVLLYALAGLGAGWAGLALMAGQSMVAILILETINYLEHYGLERQELAPGRFERVAPHHSWNSNHRISGWHLFNLPRHSDHHAWAHRPFPALRAWRDAPTLPYGYPTMVLLALVPPLWFRVMNPRVRAVREAARLAQPA